MRENLVALLVIVIPAFGTTAPDSSVTAPAMVPLGWATEVKEKRSVRRR
jgi:hypothetical protein